MFRRKTIIILFWLLMWHLLALWVNNKIMLVTPFRALQALASMLPKETFWQSVAGSLIRIGLGFLLGLVVGILLAILSNRFSFLEELLSPVISLFKAVPVASLVVLFLIWWGSSFLAVAVCFLIVLPNLYINTLEGLKATDKRLLEMADVFRIPFFNRFFYIYRPALKPFLLSGLKLSLGMSWKSGVAAEVIGTPDLSIGERLYMSKIYLETAEVFAWTAVVILLSLFFEKLVLWLAERIFAWEPACQGKGSVAGSSVQTSGVIACRGVNKAYGQQKVIQEFTASYESGQTYYMTTPSGSGKTTLLRLLCGLEQPDAGEIKRPERFSVMFQEDRLCEDYNAVRNVELVIGSTSRAREALLELLSEEALSKPCGQLSGGMKRRVALVRAMEAEAECILLDEPFTGLDADTKKLAEEYIRRRQRGRTLIMATHL
ncbi:MAG: ATP-binding cassette domain-containing protein [Acetatifactor sp.]|nr:ATP-binding cassette domain-containing protein [Acetatifactor sp.]